ncbi:hypothetical protein [Amycolatopsis alba]|uniref:Uncharacterized protein n=1 Tax=Amycolatopsis alba DSM 44262 TaxID=1125972 RepID=A0A229RW24_AMYAL|nr:hypothetical protein [Amycolatopsis alba]OXM50701.1 hypothetical protein CFP75_15675 [Amycolatopsis alba DSM 44262]
MNASAVLGTHQWTAEETRILVRAARWAPRRWLRGEWPLEVRGDGADLVERPGPDSRGRLIAGGALLVHLEVAMRALGWLPETRLPHDGGDSRLIARITAATRRRPGPDDLALFGAMSGRASYSFHGPPTLSTDEEPADGVRVKSFSPRQIRSLPRIGSAIAPPGEEPEEAWSAFLVTSASEARHHLVRAAWWRSGSGWWPPNPACGVRPSPSRSIHRRSGSRCSGSPGFPVSRNWRSASITLGGGSGRGSRRPRADRGRPARTAGA